MTPDRFHELRRMLDDARSDRRVGSGVLIEGAFRYRDRRNARTYEVVERQGRTSVLMPRIEAGAADVVAEVPIRRIAVSRLRGGAEPWGIELGEAGQGSTIAPILRTAEGFHVPLIATSVDWSGGVRKVPGGRRRALMTVELLASRLRQVDCAGFDRDEHWGFPGLCAETSMTGVDAGLHEIKDSTFLERRERARDYLGTLSVWGDHVYARAAEPVLWTGGRHGPVLIASGALLRLGVERIGFPDRILGLGELQGRHEDLHIVVRRPDAFQIDSATASAVHLVCAVRRMIEDQDDLLFDDETRDALHALAGAAVKPSDIQASASEALIDAVGCFARQARKGTPVFDHLLKLRGIVVSRVAGRLGIEIEPEAARRQPPSLRVVA